MGKGDGNIDIELRTREVGMVRTAAEFVRYQKQIDTHNRNMTRSARKAGKAAKDAGTDGSQGMQRLASGARQAMTAITGIGSAVGVIYLVKRAISSLVDEFQKIRELKGETFAASVQAQEVFQKTAALPVYVKTYGDKALETVVSQGIEIALKTGAEMDIAGESMFYVTSALSHLPEEERRAGAELMTRFGTVHGMTSEEMSGLPQLWKVEGVETGQEMQDMMNKLYVGIGESISTFGEALKHFPRLRAVQKQYDLSFEQSLSMYTGALDIMNASRARQTSMIAVELGVGRTQKGLRYLRRVARDQGITDFTSLSPADKTKVLGTHVEQMIEGKDWEGVTKFFMAMGGGRGSGRMAFMQYSPTAKRKYESTMARLEETQGQDLLGEAFAVYDKTGQARKRRTEAMMFRSDVGRGYENAALAVHNMLVDKMVERLHEQAADPVALGMIEGMLGATGMEVFRKNVGGKMIEAALTGVKPEHPEYGRTREILGMGPQLWTTQPEVMEDIMRVTGDMQTWSQGTLTIPGQQVEIPHMPGMTTLGPPQYGVPATETGPFAEAMKSVFGAEQLEAAKEQTEAIKEQTEVLKSIDAKLGVGEAAGPQPVGAPVGEMRTGNTDQ